MSTDSAEDGRLKGGLCGLGAAALFGASAPLAKLLLPGASPLSLSALLYLGAGIGLSLPALVRRPRVPARPAEAPFRGRDWALLGLISLTGGVAANSALRQALGELAQKRGLEFYCPLPKHCTDNAAMIGQVAFEYLKLGTGVHPNPLSLGASPKSPMGLMELDLGESLDVKKVDPRP